jgi:hypothetical protein
VARRGLLRGHVCAPNGERKRVSERALDGWRAKAEVHACTGSVADLVAELKNSNSQVRVCVGWYGRVKA